jgi:hypothetical protein
MLGSLAGMFKSEAQVAREKQEKSKDEQGITFKRKEEKDKKKISDGKSKGISGLLLSSKKSCTIFEY